MCNEIVILSVKQLREQFCIEMEVVMQSTAHRCKICHLHSCRKVENYRHLNFRRQCELSPEQKRAQKYHWGRGRSKRIFAKHSVKWIFRRMLWRWWCQPNECELNLQHIHADTLLWFWLKFNSTAFNWCCNCRQLWPYDGWNLLADCSMQTQANVECENLAEKSFCVRQKFCSIFDFIPCVVQHTNVVVRSSVVVFNSVKLYAIVRASYKIISWCFIGWKVDYKIHENENSRKKIKNSFGKVIELCHHKRLIVFLCHYLHHFKWFIEATQWQRTPCPMSVSTSNGRGTIAEMTWCQNKWRVWHVACSML